MGSVRVRVLGDLIAGPGRQREFSPVGHFGDQFALQQHVAAVAPVIRQISGV
jgi:hypothetical protein